MKSSIFYTATRFKIECQRGSHVWLSAIASHLLSKHWIERVGFVILLIVVFFLSKGYNEVGVSLKENTFFTRSSYDSENAFLLEKFY